jgi:MSHA biogenesis protein MshE
MLEMTEQLAEAAGKQDPAAFVKAAEEQMGGWTLRRYAVQLVTKGRTTISEAMLISNQAVE